jgi:hypothetical protein
MLQIDAGTLVGGTKCTLFNYMSICMRITGSGVVLLLFKRFSCLAHLLLFNPMLNLVLISATASPEMLQWLSNNAAGMIEFHTKQLEYWEVRICALLYVYFRFSRLLLQ